FNGPRSTEVSTLSLHDALPILIEDMLVERWRSFSCLSFGETEEIDHPFGLMPANEIATDHVRLQVCRQIAGIDLFVPELVRVEPDRKSTRLNSSHVKISYAVFC